MTAPRLRLTDRIRRWWYVSEVDTWLATVPGRRRREIRAELRQNLAAAASDIGMAQAIAEHGRPRLLARQYQAHEPRSGPVWVHGAIAFGVAIGMWVAALMSYVFGALGTLEAIGGAQQAQIGFLGLSIEVERSAASLGAGFSGWSWPSFTFFALAFLGGARAWRVGRPARRRHLADAVGPVDG